MRGAWLGQVPLRARPFMGGLVRRLGQLNCCVKTGPGGGQQQICVDTGSGQCVVTWISPEGNYPGVPACGPDGLPPSCSAPSAAAPPPPTAPPPAAPPPAAPPTPAPAPSCPAGQVYVNGQCVPADMPQAPGACPAGQTMIEGQCSPGAIACPSGAGYDLVEISADNQPTGRILAPQVPYERVGNAQGVHIVNSDDPRCGAPAAPPPAPVAPAAVPAPAAPPPTAPLPTQQLAPSVPQPDFGPLPVQNLTVPAMPTGAFPGQPFAAAAPAPAPRAVAPAAPPPPPPPCPSGPIPVEEWTKGCVFGALARLR